MKQPHRTAWAARTLVGLLWLASATLAQAAARFEDIQTLKAQQGIPQWKAAAQRIQALRANPPDAATASRWRMLDALTDPRTGKAPLAEATTHRNSAELQANASWLRWRVLSENADARYAFAYAVNLGRMGDADTRPADNFDDEAIIFYFRAKLALSLDGMRCTDRSKAEHLVAWYAAQADYRPLAQKSARMSAKDKAAAILEAISLEEMLGERPPMPWLCPRSDASTPAPASSRVDATGVPERYIEDAAWRQYRKDLLEQLTRNAAQDL